MSSQNEKPEECESCEFPTAELEHYECTRIPKRDDGKWLCRLCASTMAGNAVDYPEEYSGQRPILQAICYVGNAILDAIKKAPR